MTSAIRRTLAALAMLVLLGTSANPAQAGYISEEAGTTPVIFDALIMRPVGLLTLCVGTGLFAASLPLVAVTRPQDIDKPFDTLIARPARFLWRDPIGHH